MYKSFFNGHRGMTCVLSWIIFIKIVNSKMKSIISNFLMTRTPRRCGYWRSHNDGWCARCTMVHRLGLTELDLKMQCAVLKVYGPFGFWFADFLVNLGLPNINILTEKLDFKRDFWRF